MRIRWTHLAMLLMLLWLPTVVIGEQRFPPPDFRSGYQLPVFQTAPGRDALWNVIDVVALLVALSIAAHAAIKSRSRRTMLLLSVACVAYFGFYRKGCVCPVGSVQNVAMASFGDYAIPWTVASYFFLPLLFTLLFGRVFCAGVCPLGAIQDLVLVKPIQVPRWIEAGFGFFAWVYLGLAVLFAATGSDFVICRYDPFVGFFRFSATPQMLMLGGVLLLGSMFVGRIYCRIFCPYGLVMRWLSPLSKHRVSISPKQCIDCRLCEQSCPFGAIRQPTRKPVQPPVRSDRVRLGLTLLITPLLVGIGVGLGSLSSKSFSRVNRDVRLAQLVFDAQTHPDAPVADEVTAFRNGDRTVDEVSAQAQRVQNRFAIGTPIFGGFMGLAVGLSLAAHSLRRRSTEYLADPGTCLACARCFRDCPVEQERIAGRSIVPT